MKKVIRNPLFWSFIFIASMTIISYVNRSNKYDYKESKIDSVYYIDDLQIVKPLPIFKLTKDTVKNINKDSVKKYIRLYEIIYPEIVLAQILHESGNLTSYYALNYNNILGLKGKKDYLKFKSYKECLLYYKFHIQNRYKSGEDYYSFLERIKYCGDDSTYISYLKQY